MEITLKQIGPWEGSQSAYMGVKLRIYDEVTEGHPECTVAVFVKKGDLRLSEIKTQALEQAASFLSRALSALRPPDHQ